MFHPHPYLSCTLDPPERAQDPWLVCVHRCQDDPPRGDTVQILESIEQCLDLPMETAKEAVLIQAFLSDPTCLAWLQSVPEQQDLETAVHGLGGLVLPMASVREPVLLHRYGTTVAEYLEQVLPDADEPSHPWV